MAHPRSASPSTRRFFASLALAALLAACATPAPRVPERTPSEINADIARRIPSKVLDRSGWAHDVYIALSAQDIPTTPDNICAVLAVVEQESTYQANPPVPNLGKIARAEILKRAGEHHVPAFAVNAALKIDSRNGRSYGERIDAARTEKELSEIFDEILQRVPLGKRLFDGLNPVRTGGPMQVRIAFAEAHAQRYPYPPQDSIRDEVFTRRGGLYFGTRHLLGYPANYDRHLFRYADFNAGWYASRNAAFQAALTKASGIELQLDGDLLVPAAGLDRPGATERAARALANRLGTDERGIRRALEKADSPAFEDTDLYRQVFALAERNAGRALPRAVVPGIKLQSPKITRNLTTAWFADRVDTRWRACMRR